MENTNVYIPDSAGETRLFCVLVDFDMEDLPVNLLV
jgi:hypothetical protein